MRKLTLFFSLLLATALFGCKNADYTLPNNYVVLISQEAHDDSYR